jgi:hypothetical protein
MLINECDRLVENLSRNPLFLGTQPWMQPARPQGKPGKRLCIAIETGAAGTLEKANYIHPIGAHGSRMAEDRSAYLSMAMTPPQQRQAAMGKDQPDG